jgi:hypothetical protein
MSECPLCCCLVNDELWETGGSPFRLNERRPDGHLYILVEFDINDSEATFEYVNPENRIGNRAKLGVFAEHGEQLGIAEFSCEDQILINGQ